MALTPFAPCLCRTKALVLELLAAVCLVRGGHDIILAAFDNFKEVSPQQGRTVPTLTPVLWLGSCLSFPICGRALHHQGILHPENAHPMTCLGMLQLLGLMSPCQHVSPGLCPSQTGCWAAPIRVGMASPVGAFCPATPLGAHPGHVPPGPQPPAPTPGLRGEESLREADGIFPK